MVRVRTRNIAPVVLCAAGSSIAGILAAHFQAGGSPRFGVPASVDALWLPLRSIGYKSAIALEATALRELGGVVYGLLLVGALTGFLALLTLLLTLASRRKRDFATRAAVGAAPRDLIALVAAPTLRIAATGAGVSMVLAVAAIAAIEQVWPGPMTDAPWIRVLRAMGGILLFNAAAVASTLSGVWLITMRGVLARALSAGDRATADQTDTRVREVLLTVQVAACVILLSVAVSLTQSNRDVQRPGLTLHELNVARIEADNTTDVMARTRALERLLVRLHDTPGVSAESIASAGAVTGMTASDVIYSECDVCFSIFGKLPFTVLTARLHAVGPRYFETVGQELLRGREFTVSDAPGSPPVAIITRSFALHVFGLKGEPIGRVIRLQAGKGVAHKIVGVVADRAGVGLGTADAKMPVAYFSALQYPPANVDLIARGSAPIMPGITFRPWREVQSSVLAPILFVGRGLNVLALLCFLLATHGVFAVVRALVEGARAELAVRRMVGSPPRSLVTVLIARCARIGAVGAAVGAVLGFGALRLVQAAMPTAPVDGAGIAGAAVLLIALCVTAAAAPAYRTARSVEVSGSW